MLLTAVFCRAAEVFPVVHNEPVIVRVLDGKSGQPQPLRRVVLTGGYDERDLALGQWREEALTDSDGRVRLSNDLRNLPLLRVEVLNGHVCQPGANRAAISVDGIRLNGMSGANRCGTAMVVDAPGVFTVFIKGKKGVAPSAASTVADAAATLPVVSSVAAVAPLAVAALPPSCGGAAETTREGDRASAGTQARALASPVAPVAEEAHVSMLLSYALDNLSEDLPALPGSSNSASGSVSRDPAQPRRARPRVSTSGAVRTGAVHPGAVGRVASAATGVKLDSASAKAHAYGPSASSARSVRQRRASSTRTDTVSAKSARADVNNAYATSADVTSAGAMPVFRL
ncbi:MAG: hypothetical protein ABSF53_17615, partial [Terracidiphilus sp.]